METLDIEKLNRWAKEIHDNATAHGWHEEKHSPEHWLSLVMCEVAEAIEADRNNKRCKRKEVSNYMPFERFYAEWVKGTVEEELADIVIRLLDMKYELYDDKNIFNSYIFNDKKIELPYITIQENMWQFVKYVLDWTVIRFSWSIVFIYQIATHFGIDLDQHIEWKMKYNESRPYKHGGKKY